MDKAICEMRASKSWLAEREKNCAIFIILERCFKIALACAEYFMEKLCFFLAFGFSFPFFLCMCGEIAREYQLFQRFSDEAIY